MPQHQSTVSSESVVVAAFFVPLHETAVGRAAPPSLLQGSAPPPEVRAFPGGDVEIDDGEERSRAASMPLAGHAVVVPAQEVAEGEPGEQPASLGSETLAEGRESTRDTSLRGIRPRTRISAGQGRA